MPKFYGQNKKRIDPRYFLEETINRDDPPWGTPEDDENVIHLDPAARAKDLATGAMNDQIRNLSEKELQRAWNRLDPFGSNPEKQKEDGRAISAEMDRRFKEHFRKMTPEGGWSLDPDDDSDDAAELIDMLGSDQATRDDLISMIRDYSKELTGHRQTMADDDKLNQLSDDELQDYYRGMFDSLEAQDLETTFRDREETEMGIDEPEDLMPKQRGMGRGRRQRRTKEEEDKIRSSVLGSMAKNPPSTPWSKGR